VSEFTDIISRYLWRFFPIAWLNWVVGHLVHWAVSVLEDEDHRVWLTEDKRNCAWYGGWLSVIEQRLNELIVMKAMKHLKRTFVSTRPVRPVPALRIKTPEQALERLTRLVVRYHQAERLIERRAIKLKRLFAQAELQLEVIHHPVEPTIPMPTILRFGSPIPTTILRLGSTSTILALSASHTAQPIRGPP
jgi:hypothetical protein